MEGNFAGKKILGELAKLFAYRMMGLNWDAGKDYIKNITFKLNK
jgi:hypothetical protein